MADGSPPLPPGFRFHPTDEELILHYLQKRSASPSCPPAIIADVDIYKFNPWELPGKAMFGDREWYFFSPRDRKYPNGVRPNRSAASGYWKATGTDKPITAGKGKENIGVKKALVFYKGKPPKGEKTNWIMHEYRLLDSPNKSNTSRAVKHREDHMRLDDWVLCRIYQKTNHQPFAGDREPGDPAALDAIAKSSTSNGDMHKSFSLSELLIVEEADFSLLSRLIETPLISAIPDNPNSRHAVEPEGDGSKRRRTAANCWFGDYGNFLNSPVKQVNASSLIHDQLVSQFDFSPSFFYQQPAPSFRFGIP